MTQRIITPLSDELLTQVDNFRFNERIPSRSEAIRQLLTKGIQSSGYPSASRAAIWEAAFDGAIDQEDVVTLDDLLQQIAGPTRKPAQALATIVTVALLDWIERNASPAPSPQPPASSVI